ncbi:hypothetical protein ACMYYO_01750 [Dermacoccaceae bacterium W4C1]
MKLHGGSGSIAADTADLRAMARVLDRATADLTDQARLVAQVPAAVSPTIRAAPLAWMAVVSQTADAVAGVHGLAAVALRLAATARALRATAAAYDAAQLRSIRALEAAAAGVLTAARGIGLGRDDVPLVVSSVTPAPTRPLPVAVGAPTQQARNPGAPVGGLSGAFAVLHDLGSPAAGRAGSRIRAQRVLGRDGQYRWLVSIPGTQDWSWDSPLNPSDGPTNLALIAGVDTRLVVAVAQAVTTAMASAGVQPGTEEVMLSGHSQGGLVATRMAADPHLRQALRITAVTTIGSPVSRIPLPPEVSGLSVEHRQDPVPRLDLRADADLNRVRVVLDASPTAASCTDSAGPGPHDAGRYSLSVAQQLEVIGPPPDARATAWQYQHSGFFTGSSAQTFEYQLSRPVGSP